MVKGCNVHEWVNKGNLYAKYSFIDEYMQHRNMRMVFESFQAIILDGITIGKVYFFLALFIFILLYFTIKSIVFQKSLIPQAALIVIRFQGITTPGNIQQPNVWPSHTKGDMQYIYFSRNHRFPAGQSFPKSKIQ